MTATVLSAAEIEGLLALARRAGAAIRTIYSANDGAGLQFKQDDSPLTAADLAAHQLLVSGLVDILDIPIISEEGELPLFAARARWSRYWLIDPLDGTREFVERNGEFTVNIALIEQGVAVLGVVHVPVSDITYIGINPPQAGAKKALKYRVAAQPDVLQVRPLQSAYDAGLPLTVLVSHRYASDALTTALMATLRARWPGEVVAKSAGSSLKFCLLAEGQADFYPRLAPTSEWDTAAAQAVLEAAGGTVVAVDDSGNPTLAAAGKWMPLRYNTRDSILNPFFYALGDARFNWQSLLP